MADGFVQITPDSNGKYIDNDVFERDGKQIYRQRTQVFGQNPSTGKSEEIWKDKFTGALTQIDISHAAIHLGLYMGHSGMITLLAGEYYDHLFKTPANFEPAIHLRTLQFSATTAPIIHRLYEAPVVIDEGVAGLSFNFSRNSNPPVLQMMHFPTVDITGIAPFSTRLISGAIGVGGVGQTSGTEWDLLPNTYYLSRVTNDSGTGADINYIAEWYEL